MSYPVKLVNKILKVIGFQTINRIDFDDPDTADAYGYIEDADEDLQSSGFWFNTDFNVTLNLTTDGTVIIPSNALRVRFFNTALVDRGGYVYDRVLKTSVFDADIVAYSVTYLRDYDECPTVYQLALKAKAKYDAFTEIDGDATITQKLERETATRDLKLRQEQLAKREDTALNGTRAAKLLGGMGQTTYSSQYLGGFQTRPWE